VVKASSGATAKIVSASTGSSRRLTTVMLADGGDCLADLRAVRDQEPLFGPVASDATAFRVIDAIAADPALLGGLRAARARARANAWTAGVAPEPIVIDIDATLITAHSEKEGAAGTYKRGFGFHPLLAYLDQTREALAGVCGRATPAQTPPQTTSRSSSWRSSSSRARLSSRRSSWCAPTVPPPRTSSPTSCAPRASTS
jgi:hypothetical protein